MASLPAIVQKVRRLAIRLRKNRATRKDPVRIQSIASNLLQIVITHSKWTDAGKSEESGKLYFFFFQPSFLNPSPVTHSLKTRSITSDNFLLGSEASFPSIASEENLASRNPKIALLLLQAHSFKSHSEQNGR